MEENDCNNAIKIVTALAIILFIFGASAILERNNLLKENAQLKDYNYKLLTARAECSPLGFCIGDKVEPTDDAKRWNITIGGVVRKIEGKLLTIDTGTPDSQNWQAVDEAWVRHRSNQASQEEYFCYGVLNTTTPDTTDWEWVCDKGVPPPNIHINNNTVIVDVE